MAALPEPLMALMAALGKLPGVGPRSAERMALHLVQADPVVVAHLADTILNTRSKVRACGNCGALTERDPCDLCTDTRRDAQLLCLVEQPVDIISIEKSATFRGRYHVLGGRISPTTGVGPEELRIAELETRLTREPIKELVMALSSDVEGDATSYYLAKRLARPGLKITRLAQGLPAGSGLEYADEVTLGRALEGRRELP